MSLSYPELSPGSLIRLKRPYQERYQGGVIANLVVCPGAEPAIYVYLFDSRGQLLLDGRLPYRHLVALADLVLIRSAQGHDLHHDFFPPCPDCGGFGCDALDIPCATCTGRGKQFRARRVHPELL
jgi:hypothetical protein